MKKENDSWVLIPEEKLSERLDACDKHLINEVCPNCRHRMCGVPAHPYAYDTKSDEIIYAVKCEQCGEVVFDTIEFPQYTQWKESFFVIAISNETGLILNDENQYCKKYSDKEEAIKASEELAWQLSCCDDVIEVYALGGFYENENGNFIDVHLRQVYITCNVEYTQPPQHILERLPEEERSLFENS